MTAMSRGISAAVVATSSLATGPTSISIAVSGRIVTTSPTARTSMQRSMVAAPEYRNVSLMNPFLALAAGSGTRSIRSGDLPSSTIAATVRSLTWTCRLRVASCALTSSNTRSSAVAVASPCGSGTNNSPWPPRLAKRKPLTKPRSPSVISAIGPAEGFSAACGGGVSTADLSGAGAILSAAAGIRRAMGRIFGCGLTRSFRGSLAGSASGTLANALDSSCVAMASDCNCNCATSGDRSSKGAGGTGTRSSA